MFFVFLLVGIWHGPNLTYLLFGVYNGIIILIETIINETRKVKKIKPKEHKKSTQRFITFLKWSLTFMLVFFGKYLSAAPSVEVAFNWFIATFQYNSFSLLFSDFLNRTNFIFTNLIILIISTAILIFVEVMQEKGIKIRDYILAKKEIVQWVVFFVAIFCVVLLTTYGGGGGFAYENF